MDHAFRPTPRSPLSLLHLLCPVMVISATGTIAIAKVECNVTHVGFPSLGEGDVIRSGMWTAIMVDLALVGQASFDGVLRAAQFDTDGDKCFDAVEVHLSAETGGTQRLYLYAVANPGRFDGPFEVELRANDGEVAAVVSQGVVTYRARPAEQPTRISHDDILVLSISSSTLGRVRELADPKYQERLNRRVHLAHVSPADLPGLRLGFEAVDFIIWDDAKPEELTQQQTVAIVQWVRHGGTLLIGAARTAGALRLSKEWDAILPVDLGEVVAVDNLRATREALMETPVGEGDARVKERDWLDVGFPAPVPVVRCKRRPHAHRVAFEPSRELELITRHRVGRGHVIYSAITLGDLFSAPGGTAKFFRKLFYFTAPDDSEQGRPIPVPLFDHVSGAVAFATSGSLYLLVAAIFSIAYIAVATFGSWAFLSARGWRKHSWTAFALVGFVASFFSVIAVGSLRGLSDRLHQVSIVDLDAGERYGYATTLFGLKSGIDKAIDVWLPSDWKSASEPHTTSCFLRPIPAGGDVLDVSTSFADPEAYRLRPASAVIEGVRVRATLKRFEGRWEGPVRGTLSGEIATHRGRITDGSYIINDLGVDLTNCYLLQPMLNPGATASLRDTAIYAFGIRNIPASGERILLAPLCYPEEGVDGDDREKRPTLADAHRTWSKPLGRIFSDLGGGPRSRIPFDLTRGQNALLLLSTIGEFDPSKNVGTLQAAFGYETWSRDRLGHLDLTSQLFAGRGGGPGEAPEPGSVVLVGFAADPGPVRLFTRSGSDRFTVLQPENDHSWTMYRIRIPVTRLDSVAAPRPSDDELGG